MIDRPDGRSIGLNVSGRQLRRSALEVQRIPESRQKILAAIDTVSVVTASCALVHEQRSGLARVSAFAKDACAGRGRFQRRTGIALVVAGVEGIGGCAGEHDADVDDHAIDALVAVGRDQGLGRGPEFGRREGPDALLGALRDGVAHPGVDQMAPVRRVQRLGGEVRRALVLAEVLHQHVGRREHQIHGVVIRGELAIGRQRAQHQVLDVEHFQIRPEAVFRVVNLPADLHVRRHGRVCRVSVSVHQAPPVGHGWRLHFMHVERAYKIVHDLSLGHAPVSIQDQIDGSGAARQQGPVVVGEDQRISID
ncbi:hypothetical protein Mapa_014128 [Marchantia paleacea]|nr:hypothetical protein Mapa_014128 [Marchantia paleacea]